MMPGIRCAVRGSGRGIAGFSAARGRAGTWGRTARLCNLHGLLHQGGSSQRAAAGSGLSALAVAGGAAGISAFATARLVRCAGGHGFFAGPWH